VSHDDRVLLSVIANGALLVFVVMFVIAVWKNR